MLPQPHQWKVIDGLCIFCGKELKTQYNAPCGVEPLIIVPAEMEKEKQCQSN